MSRVSRICSRSNYGSSPIAFAPPLMRWQVFRTPPLGRGTFELFFKTLFLTLCSLQLPVHVRIGSGSLLDSSVYLRGGTCNKKTRAKPP